MQYSIRPCFTSGIFSVPYFKWLSFIHFWHLMCTLALQNKTNTLLTALMRITGALYRAVSCVAKFQNSARIISHSRLPRRVCIGIEIFRYLFNSEFIFSCSFSCRICISDNFSWNMRKSSWISFDVSFSLFSFFFLILSIKIEQQQTQFYSAGLDILRTFLLSVLQKVSCVSGVHLPILQF